MDLNKSLPQGIIETFDPELKRAFQVNDEIPESLKDYRKISLKKGFLKVSGDQVFYTVQGEGVTIGYPAVFLRLKICNLRCVWCDAWYTWNPKSKEFWQEGEDWNIIFTAQKIKQAWNCKDSKIQKRLVVTGGEPLLQKQEIDKLIDELLGWKIEIETNGTIEPTLKQLKVCQFNCSPKLDNSGNAKQSRIRPNVLRLLNTLDNSWFKFVVMSEEDVEEIEKDFIKPYELNPQKVILMPQGVKEEEIQVNMKNVVEIAKVKGYRLLGRLHVSIWGAKRKV